MVGHLVAGAIGGAAAVAVIVVVIVLWPYVWVVL